MFGVFARLGCLLGRHEPDRRKVKEDGTVRLGRCVHCATPLEKRLDDRWRPRK